MPRYGLIAFASSLDQIGPFSLSAADAALVLQAIGGADPRDATSSPEPMPDLPARLDGRAAGVRIGVPKAFVGEGVDQDVLAAFNEALRALEGRGATLVDVRAHLAGVGLAKQKWPESLHAVEGDFPRTPSGKVQKYRLRQSLRDGQPWK